MPLLAITLASFFLATLVHAGSLLVKKRRTKYSFSTHLWLTSPLWLVVVILAVVAGAQPPDFAVNLTAKLLGWVMGVSGLGIAAWHFALLGFYQTMGSRFFKIPPRIVRRGLYAAVKNPMYVGFTLAFFGFSFAVGSLPLFALGISSIVLLHLFLVPIENGGVS